MNLQAAEHQRILVVEDELVHQKRLRKILIELKCDEDMIHVTSSIDEADLILSQYQWDYAFVDLVLPDGKGEYIIEALHRMQPDTSITVISSWNEPTTIFNALRVGATGYLLKERDDLEIMLGIRSALRGGAPVDPFIAKMILEEFHQSSQGIIESTPMSPLSQRENQILICVADGLSNKEIANNLNISRYTVETHVKSIYRKLEVSSRLNAVKIARDSGFIV